MPRVGIPVALTAVLVWALQEPGDVRPASEGPDRTASEPAREAAPQRTPTPDLDDDPVIVDIAIEPPSVCAGADVLVRVQVAEAYRDATVIVANAEANPAIVRTYRPRRRGIPIAVWRGGQLLAERELVEDDVTGQNREDEWICPLARNVFGPGAAQRDDFLAEWLIDDGHYRMTHLRSHGTQRFEQL